jgi:hypothetical protein
MNENDWLTSRFPHTMLTYVRPRASARKKRLFAVACCRQVERLIRDDRIRAAVEAAEAFAEGTISNSERTRIAASAVFDENYRVSLQASRAHQAARSAIGEISEVANAAIFASMSLSIDQSQKETRVGRLIVTMQQHDSLICDLLRDVVNPFFDEAVEPEWRSKNAVALAETIDRDRSYDMLPILGDALMDAGCTSERLLAHCRSAGPHVRGCWAVDLVLGKE